MKPTLARACMVNDSIWKVMSQYWRTLVYRERLGADVVFDYRDYESDKEFAGKSNNL